MCAPVFDPQTGRLLNREEVDAAYARLRKVQAEIARPSVGEFTLSYTDARADADHPSVQNEGQDLELVLHDLSAAPDREYRYRVRVRCWNRFVGRPDNVLDAEDARHPALASPWSEPSEPVRAAAPVCVFAYSPGLSSGQANFEVWKWHRGHWVRRLFTAAAGEVIGGPSRVRIAPREPTGKSTRETVDLSTPYVLLGIRGGDPADADPDSLLVTLFNRDTDDVCERVIPGDRDDPRRARMRLAVAESSDPGP